MGQIYPPKLVLPLLAVTSRHDSAFCWAQTRFADAFGPIELVSRQFDFDQTDYYTESMGPELRKQFLAAQQLMDPQRLSRWKVETNAWESEYLTTCEHPEERPLNLDPGYIAEDKLVLASTKNHAHRIYLDEGIYAEFTLQFRSRQWQACPWTYPDYRQTDFQDFFLECRNYLRQAMRQTET